FFFQAEDGIRSFHVTGVQTCALPICADRMKRGEPGFEMLGLAAEYRDLCTEPGEFDRHALAEAGAAAGDGDHLSVVGAVGKRLEIGRASCRERVEVLGVSGDV